MALFPPFTGGNQYRLFRVCFFPDMVKDTGKDREERQGIGTGIQVIMRHQLNRRATSAIRTGRMAILLAWAQRSWYWQMPSVRTLSGERRARTKALFLIAASVV